MAYEGNQEVTICLINYKVSKMTRVSLGGPLVLEQYNHEGHFLCLETRNLRSLLKVFVERVYGPFTRSIAIVYLATLWKYVK